MIEPTCSATSRQRGDPLAGTASHVRGFLLVEDPGPWGASAWQDARLPDGLGRQILRRCAAVGVRPLLIRRQRPGSLRTRADGSAVPVRRRVFAAYPARTGTVLQSATLGDPREVLDLDIEGLAQGRSPGLPLWTDPVFAVCTQGRHDRCCATLGRPVAVALAASQPESTWQVSHLGGDRFAGNLLVLGEALCYGRLHPATAVHVAHEHRAGRLDLDLLRGRSYWPMPVQAAEIALRRALGLIDLAGVSFVGRDRDSPDVVVTFAVGQPAHRWSVRVRPEHSPPARLTCRSKRAEPSVSWPTVDIARCGPAAV